MIRGGMRMNNLSRHGVSLDMVDVGCNQKEVIVGERVCACKQMKWPVRKQRRQAASC